MELNILIISYNFFRDSALNTWFSGLLEMKTKQKPHKVVA